MDYAADISPEGARLRQALALERTRTFPFIAIQILTAEEPHRYRHDLESLFYVLVCLCIYPCAPPHPTQPPSREGTPSHSHAPTPREATWPPSDPLKLWFSLDHDCVAAYRSFNIVLSKSAFEDLLARFKPGPAWAMFKRVTRK